MNYTCILTRVCFKYIVRSLVPSFVQTTHVKTHSRLFLRVDRFEHGGVGQLEQCYWEACPCMLIGTYCSWLDERTSHKMYILMIEYSNLDVQQVVCVVTVSQRETKLSCE